MSNEDNLYLLSMIKRIFSAVCLVRVTQIKGWKFGKTDFALLLAEILLKLKIVDEVATNIYTYGKFLYIYDKQSLDDWFERSKYDRKIRLYIFDEVNEHVSNRRAMSRKNVSVISIFPQLSKHRGRMIAIAQDFDKADPDLSSSSWVRATFTKLTKTDVSVQTDFLDVPLTFHNIPRTEIPFDPEQIAPFMERPENPEVIFKDQELNIMDKYVEGAKCRELGMNQQEFSRFNRKTMKKLLDFYKKYSGETKEAKEIKVNA